MNRQREKWENCIGMTKKPKYIETERERQTKKMQGKREQERERRRTEKKSEYKQKKEQIDKDKNRRQKQRTKDRQKEQQHGFWMALGFLDKQIFLVVGKKRIQDWSWLKRLLF